MKKAILLTLIILIIFLGAGFIAYLVKEHFQTLCYKNMTSLQDSAFVEQFNQKFIDFPAECIAIIKTISRIVIERNIFGNSGECAHAKVTQV